MRDRIIVILLKPVNAALCRLNRWLKKPMTDTPWGELTVVPPEDWVWSDVEPQTVRMLCDPDWEAGVLVCRSENGRMVDHYPIPESIMSAWREHEAAR